MFLPVQLHFHANRSKCDVQKARTVSFRQTRPSYVFGNVWRFLGIAFLYGLIVTQSCPASIDVAPMPEGEVACEDYSMTVEGQPVPIYSCRVSACPLNQTWPGYQRPLEQTELAGFAYWDMDEPVTIEIDSKRDIESVTIRPLSLGIVPQIDGNHLSFTLNQPGPVVVEVNDFHHALHLFPSSKRPPLDKNRQGLHYFGPGVHDMGVLTLKSNESVYIDAGAVVYGSILADHVSNVRVEGRGILDGSKMERDGQPWAIQPEKPCGTIKFTHSTNVHIEGIVQRDPNIWTTNIQACDQVTIKNTYLIGLWRYNADGIDICNSKNILVEGCFVRAFDDALVIKGLPVYQEMPILNHVFRNCVVWCDWGRSLEIGAETCAPEISNIVFENCDVIRSTHVALDIQHSDQSKIHDIRFENIRVEFDAWCPLPVYQNDKDQKYTTDPENRYCPKLITIVIGRNGWSGDIRGTVRNVLYKDIQVYGNPTAMTTLDGIDDAHNIDGVTIENLRFNQEKPVQTEEEMNLLRNPFVSNIQIVP